MRFYIEEVEVLFPYDYIYPEQYEYMVKLKSVLTKGHCILEMPTGTGKTITLLSLILAYQYAHPSTGKLIYCTRTVQEMDKVLEELRRLMEYRSECLLGSSFLASSSLSSSSSSSSSSSPSGINSVVPMTDEMKNPMILGVCLSSRRNMCIHPTVSKYDNPAKVDAMCRNMTASFVREDRLAEAAEAERASGSSSSSGSSGARGEAEEKDIELCEFYEGYSTTGSDAALSGVYSLADMKELGKRKGWCPYFMARHLITLANVVVYNYQYMLDPRISGMVSKEIEKESIVVFDEAHNIDNICIEALSVTLDKKIISSCTRNLNQLSASIARMERNDMERLNQEYRGLLEGLTAAGAIPEADAVASNPVLSRDVLATAVPGSIRRAKHFVMFLRTLVEYLKNRCQKTALSVEKPESFVFDLKSETNMRETRALKFCYDRLNSLLRTLKINNLDEFTPLTLLTNFATLVGTYQEGFVVIYEPFDDRTAGISDPRLQLCCLDASLAIKPVFDRFSSVVITSGTMSPIDMFPKILNFRPALSESISMSLFRNCICPLIVTKGSDQNPMTTKFEKRTDESNILNYGLLLLEMCAVIPDGIAVFFTSYEYLENVISEWSRENVDLLNKILKHKLIFIETKDTAETGLALDAYKQACDSGRGAVFFSIARGKVAEGVDFDRHYGRAVFIMGVPFQYTLSRVLRARMEYLREKFRIQERDFLSFDALRQASQCAGRVIRSKMDYGIMVFADMRYSSSDKRNKLPGWITQYLKPEHMNLSTDRAVQEVRAFLKQMAQPLKQEDLLGTAMLAADHPKIRGGSGTRMAIEQANLGQEGAGKKPMAMEFV